ncbi:PH domain-containing protein [Nocardioides terrisoli]|uniref:PH domain-containing protein n=1 Tax=Nocardioides terrisoli TaxID=3388267 RepID=UPI00287B9287|nr:PH domain-containing protein [Nocardioides marmorisolisilvae]
MAISPRLLNEGEQVVFSTRTHPKALLAPLAVLVVVLVGAGFLAVHTHGLLEDVVWVVAVLLLLAFTVWPALGWLTATYTVTDRRLLTRSGVLTRTGHDIPLSRISDVSYERGLLDRMLGCGTLVISDASTHGRVTLPDVPHVEQLHLKIADQLFDHAKTDDGT